MFLARNKHRINILSALILVTLTLAAGISVYVVMQRQAESLLSKSLEVSLQNNVRLFENQIDQSLINTQTVATRLNPIKNLQLLESKPGNATAKAELQKIALSFLPTGFTGMSFYDVLGHEVVRAGHFSQKHDLRVSLKTNNRAFLMWDGQFILHVSIDMLDERGHRVGTVMTEANLPLLTRAISAVGVIGKTDELAVCVALVDDVRNTDCFIRRISGKEFKRYPLMMENKPLPMNYALSGNSGIVFTRDYRREEVIAAYAPVGSYGLGMVLKIDQAEMYQPVVEQLKFIALVLAALVLAGILLLHVLVRPLVRKLVNSEQATRAANTLLCDSEARFANIVNLAADAIISVDEEQRILIFNYGAEKIFGYTAVEMLGQPLDRLIPERYAEAHRVHIRQFGAVPQTAPHTNQRSNILGRRKDGSEFFADTSISRVMENGKQVFTVFLRDISARKQAEEEIRQLNADLRQFKDTLDQTLDCIFMFDPDTLRFIYVNEGAKRQVGYSEAELLKMTPVDIKPEITLEQFQKMVQPLIDGVLPVLTFQTVHRHKDGHDIPVEIFLQLVRLEGQASRFMAMVADISARKQAEEEIHRLAYIDTITGLPNRTRFHELVEEAVVAAQREQRPIALLLMDLDRFKEVNDTLGHKFGDGLLQKIGTRLRSALFAPDVIARLGGDEFGILLPRLATIGDVMLVIKKLQHLMEAPFILDEIPIVVEAAIGVATMPGHASDADTLLQQADIAMYYAKQMASGYAIYTPEYNLHTPERLGLMAELRDAVEQNQLLLHFQPKLELKTGRIIGTEALVRWQHPLRGLLFPDKFILAAEQTGLVGPLTRWVLSDALSKCQGACREGIRMRVSVNLSARSLHDPQLPGMIAAVLAASGVEPGLLMLEITESAIVLDPARAEQTLVALSGMGIGLSIDDFGTGYTSLASIKRLPINEIKIDRSFITDMLTNKKDAMIVRTIIELGHNFGLTVVAEGVETQEVLDALAALGCDEIQGYFISKPQAFEPLKSWLSTSSYKIGPDSIAC